jgi:uncharacterized protein YggU (UPF0235/DUF167 family)
MMGYMIGREFHFHDGEKGAALTVRLVRYRKADRIHKLLQDGTVVVHIKGQPENLNKTLIKLLSNELSIAQKRFDIVAGADGDDKLVSILDVEPVTLQELIINAIP